MQCLLTFACMHTECPELSPRLLACHHTRCLFNFLLLYCLLRLGGPTAAVCVPFSSIGAAATQLSSIYVSKLLAGAADAKLACNPHCSVPLALAQLLRSEPVISWLFPPPLLALYPPRSSFFSPHLRWQSRCDVECHLVLVSCALCRRSRCKASMDLFCPRLLHRGSRFELRVASHSFQFSLCRPRTASGLLFSSRPAPRDEAAAAKCECHLTFSLPCPSPSLPPFPAHPPVPFSCWRNPSGA